MEVVAAAVVWGRCSALALAALWAGRAAVVVALAAGKHKVEGERSRLLPVPLVPVLLPLTTVPATTWVAMPRAAAAVAAAWLSVPLVRALPMFPPQLW